MNVPLLLTQRDLKHNLLRLYLAQPLRAVIESGLCQALQEKSRRPLAYHTTHQESLQQAMPKVFISHSSLDRDFIEREIVSLLKRNGIDIWYSKDDIQTAEAWERSIRQALKSCDWFLIALSPRSITSRWVEREVFWAMDHRDGRIVPVMIEACDPTDLHLGFGPIQYVNFTRDLTEARKKLLAVWGIKEQNADEEELKRLAAEKQRREEQERQALQERALALAQQEALEKQRKEDEAQKLRAEEELKRKAEEEKRLKAEEEKEKKRKAEEEKLRKKVVPPAPTPKPINWPSLGGLLVLGFIVLKLYNSCAPQPKPFVTLPNSNLPPYLRNANLNSNTGLILNNNSSSTNLSNLYQKNNSSLNSNNTNTTKYNLNTLFGNSNSSNANVNR